MHMTVRPIAMPSDPTAKGIRRPRRSTIMMPTIVARMLKLVVITCTRKAWSSGMPTDCHRVLE